VDINADKALGAANEKSTVRVPNPDPRKEFWIGSTDGDWKPAGWFCSWFHRAVVALPQVCLLDFTAVTKKLNAICHI
jgi:hypothetical protein